MGWFDDSDSEDEAAKNANRRLCPLDPLAPPAAFDPFQPEKSSVAGEDDEEEDPLDAYMNGVRAATTATATPATEERRADTRLDMENEEEATAHWTTPAAAVTTGAAADHGGGEGFGTADTDRFERRRQPRSSSSSSSRPPSTYDSIRARAEMASTFQKAGTKPTSTSASATQTDRGGVRRGREDDDVEAERSAKRTIDPLAAVDHGGKSYAPFRKSFWNPPPSSSAEARDWRNTNVVTCSVDVDPVAEFRTYGDGGSGGGDGDVGGGGVGGGESGGDGVFAPEVLGYLEKNGYRNPTPVQAQAIPVALGGWDLLVTSQTGSGKTLAYLLPILTHILDQPHIRPSVDGPIALVLTPTRELARQVHLVAKKLLHTVSATAVAVTGGMGTYEMTKELKRGCELVVSTPGRFIDMVGGGNGSGSGGGGGVIPAGKRRKAATNCERITVVVLDEADKMLEMGFESQVGSILQNVRPDRQSLMFSATFGKRIERVAKGWLRNPVRIAVGRTGSSSEHVTQHVLVLPSREAKKQWLVEMWPILAGLGRLIVFVASRAGCDEITDLLRRSGGDKNGTGDVGGGLRVDSIHGDRHQSDRNAALSKLRKGKLDALVATDVAARGLDVTDVMTVCNFDCAKNLDSHVHRVGRAGRLSNKHKAVVQEGGSCELDGEERRQQHHKKGAAYTLLTPQNTDFANVLVEAFRRERREISDELLQLSKKSRYSAGGNGGGGGQKKWNRTGLGFRDEKNDDMAFAMPQFTGAPPRRPHGFSSTNGYGEEGGQQTAKRSRWGS